MTILHDTDRTLALGSADEENNPIVLWDNKATVSNISSVTGVATDGAAINAVNGTTYDFAMPLVSVFDSASLNLTGITDEFTIAAIAAHNIGTIGAKVSIQYSTNSGSTWLDCGAGEITPENDDVIIWRFDAVTAADWRMIIEDIPSGEQPAIGVLFMGAETIIPQRMYQGYTPPLTPTNVTLQSNVSEGNHLLGGSAVARGSSISVSIDHLPDTFIRGTDWLGFQDHFNTGKGFFWAWRPAKYGDAFYAWRTGETIAPPNSGPSARMSVSFEARAYHE